LCIFPSLYEPFGIVALVAAAMSKVAVVGASGFSGMKEIVRHQGSDKPTGVHVNRRDPRDIAWGINLVLENSELRKTWGSNDRQRILENFTWMKAAEKTLAIYEEALSSRS
jgi:glycogen synthase